MYLRTSLSLPPHLILLLLQGCQSSFTSQYIKEKKIFFMSDEFITSPNLRDDAEKLMKTGDKVRGCNDLSGEVMSVYSGQATDIFDQLHFQQPDIPQLDAASHHPSVEELEITHIFDSDEEEDIYAPTVDKSIEMLTHQAPSPTVADQLVEQILYSSSAIDEDSLPPFDEDEAAVPNNPDDSSSTFRDEIVLGEEVQYTLKNSIL
jgi:hypothetical protein